MMLLNTQKKPLRNTILGLIILAITSLLGLGGLDAQTNLVFPANNNHYQDSYLLPDGTIRMIGNEVEHYAGLFFVDRLPDGRITNPSFYPQMIGDQYYNFAGVDCHILLLKEGNCILGINQIDCDYPPPPGICFSNDKGEILWADYLEEYPSAYFIERLVLVDENVFCILFQEGGRLYIDLEGNHIELPNEYTIYDQVINATDGYMAALGSWLFLLDDQFDKLDSTYLEDLILTIQPVADTAVLVSTRGSVFLLKADLTEVRRTDLYSQINFIAASKESFWLSRVNGHDLFTVRHDLTPKDTFKMPADVLIKDIKIVEDDVVVTGSYINAVGSSMFFHTSPSESFSFDVQKDIRIDFINVTEPVWYDPEPFSFGGYNIGYDSVVVSVTNTGMDVINTVNIQYKEDTGCGMCDGGHIEWSFDSLMILPGQQQLLDIGHFWVWCRQVDVHQLCFRAAPADSLPEVDHLNNKLCVEVIAFLTGIHEAGPSEFRLSPNPASDMITLSIDGVYAGDYHGVINNGNGDPVERFEMPENRTEISLMDYPSGIYFLTIMNSQGVYLSKKFIVIH